MAIYFDPLRAINELCEKSWHITRKVAAASQRTKTGNSLPVQTHFSYMEGAAFVAAFLELFSSFFPLDLAKMRVMSYYKTSHFLE